MAHQLIRLADLKILLVLIVALLLAAIDEDSAWGDDVDCTKLVYHRSCRGYGMK